MRNQPKNRNGSSRVCIIGAGISGLVTAKTFNEEGFDVTLFDQAKNLGGVWDPDRRYPGVRANNSRRTYAFSDFPYPETAETFPTGENVFEYLSAYAEHFGLNSFIKLSTRVTEVRKNKGTDDFFVRTSSVSSGEEEEWEFDFVVVCNGTFSKPYIPEIKGIETFAGQVVHSSEFTDPGLAKGKRVIVIGGSKSAYDCAEDAQKYGISSTLVFRQPHWMFPRYFGDKPADEVLMSRFSEMWLTYHRKSILEKFLHTLGKPLVWLWWMILKRALRTMSKMPPEFVPTGALPGGLEKGGVAGNFFQLIRENKILWERASVREITAPDKLIVDNGKILRGDLIILATGWQQEVRFLDPELKKKVIKDGYFHLFRHILPPEETKLGFIGYQSSLACNLTSEMAARWLCRSFKGDMKLPERAKMEQSIEKVRHWMAKFFPESRTGFFIGPFVIHYIDELMRDMGLETQREKNALKEFFAPYFPSRYKDLGRKQKVEKPLETIPY